MKECFAIKFDDDNYSFNRPIYLVGNFNASIVPKEEYENWQKRKLVDSSDVPAIPAIDSDSTKPHSDEVQVITKLLSRDEVVAGDRITTIYIEGKKNVDSFLRDWPFLKNKIAPKQIFVSLNISGSKVHLELREVQLDKAPIIKISTIINDLVQFSEIDQVTMAISVIDTKHLDTYMVNDIKEYQISKLQVKRES